MNKNLQDNDLPLMFVLVMHNEHARPLGLVDELAEELDFITLKSMPLNMTPLIHTISRLFQTLKAKDIFKRV